MFQKNNEQKLESVIGANSSFKGNINVKGTVRIDGSFDGEIEADWLILGEKSHVIGNASAKGVIIGGTFEGNIAGKESVEIKSKGQVIGDIKTMKLNVHEGGVLNGHTVMQNGDKKAIELKKGISGEIELNTVTN